MRAVFADCHVGRRPDDDGPFLEALNETTRRGARSVTLLGDIFHFFIAHPKFETPAIRRLLDMVERLSAQGVSVTYVEGNRDFFLRGSYVERYFRQVVDEESFTEGGRRFLATHGDLLNERDAPYRFWRALSKNPAVPHVDAVIPQELRQPAGLEDGGAAVPLELQAQVPASGRDDPRLRRAAVPGELRRPASRTFSQSLERETWHPEGSRSSPRSSRSAAGWRSMIGARRSWSG